MNVLLVSYKLYLNGFILRNVWKKKFRCNVINFGINSVISYKRKKIRKYWKKEMIRNY